MLSSGFINPFVMDVTIRRLLIPIVFIGYSINWGFTQNYTDSFLEAESIFAVVDNNMKNSKRDSPIDPITSNNPECPLPMFPRVTSYSDEAINIAWFDPDDAIGDYSYIVRSIKIPLEGGSSATVEIPIDNQNTFSLTNVEKGNAYYIQLKRICQEADEQLESGWADVGYVNIEDDNDQNNPICDQLINPTIHTIGDTDVVIGWDGPTTIVVGNATFEVDYIFDIIPIDEPNIDTRRIKIFDETTAIIEDLVKNTTYEFFITMVVDGLELVCEADLVGIITTTNDNPPVTPPSTDEEEEEPPITLPEFVCGDDFTVPEIDNTTPLPFAESEDIFYIGGYPILVDTVTGVGGTFSGKGTVPLPFTGEIVSVSFTNIKVNLDYEVWEGTVNGIADNPANYPNFEVQPAILSNQDICQPLPLTPGFDENGIYQPGNTVYNPQGFDANGNYANPPCDSTQAGVSCDPNYDPNGFDADGNHVDTGTPYNPNGCGQNGLDANGQPCNPSGECPYYWMVNCNTTPTAAGSNYANQVENQIPLLVHQALAEFLLKTNDSINIRRTECSALRAEVETLIATLGYNDNKELAFGDNDIFLNEDMSQYYTSNPKERETSTDLVNGQEDLELKNIELYDCDVLLTIFKRLRAIIEANQENSQVNIHVATLLDLISKFDSTEVNYYTANPDSLYNWVRDEMGKIITNIYETEYGPLTDNSTMNIEGLALRSIVPESRKRYFKKPKKNFSIPPKNFVMSHNYLADLGGDNGLTEAFVQSLDLTPDDISFQYGQGWEYIGEIHRAHFLKAISQYQSLSMDETSEHKMPVRVTKEVFGREYVIFLDNIVFTTAGASLDAYFLLEIPSTGSTVVFKALDIAFGPTGLKVDTRLELVNDIEIRLNNSAKLIIEGSESTYVAWDCDGFAGMGIDAEIEFCRNYFIPLDPQTLDTLPAPAKVRANFQAEMPAWAEFVADSLALDPFVIKGVEDIKWQVENLVFDFSESTTPNTIKVPNNYNSPFVSEGGQISPLWKGFYMQNLSATLPKKITGDMAANDSGSTNCPSGSSVPSSDGSLTVAVNDVIIDDMGFTGAASVSPILDLNQGNLGGWAISIDTFKIAVVANRLAGTGFNGKVHVPILSGTEQNGECITVEDCLDYSAMVMPGNEYHFSVFAGQDYFLPIWKAGVKIDSTSTVGIKLIDNEFIATATLNGAVYFDSDLPIKMDSIPFHSLEVSNKNPYFSPGVWGVPTSIGAEFSGFGISLEDIMVKETDNEDEIAFDWTTIIKLTEKVNLTGAAGFSVIGELDDSNGRQRWKFKKFKVNKILVDGSFPGVESIYGLVEFFEGNQTYGKGFRGILETKFAGKTMDVAIQAGAIFGAIKEPEEYKYFMVDALAAFDPGIKMGALQLLGFGGGVYQHMKRLAPGGVTLPNQATDANPTLPPIGASLSGVIYTPDKSVSIGLKASVVIATANKSVFNGNATFEIAFNSGGGFATIAFTGNARFLELPDLQADNNGGVGKPNNGAPINAFINIVYDNQEKTLDATFDVYANLLNIVKGAGTNDKLSSTALHIGEDSWYINIGTPNNPGGLKAVIPGVKDLFPNEDEDEDSLYDLIKFNSYLNVGTNIPPMPPLPDNVAMMTGASNFMANESLRASGRGVAFGASFAIGTGDLDFLAFYANFQMGGGFDVMMQDYGDAVCLETNEPLGINGWYASGQAYAYVQGDIGIKVKVFGKNQRLKILSIGAGAALQAKLPNPFWAKGSVGGYYRVLGGLVKGNCNFEVTLGNSCTIIGADDPVESLQVISQITPVDSDNIEVFTQPIVQFNVPLNKPFELPGLDGPEVYKAGVQSVICTSSNGSNISGATIYNYDKTLMTFQPFNMFPANDSLTFTVKAYITKGFETIKEETWTVTYFTGDALNYIPESNIAAVYPIKGQYNFYKEEWSQQKGYIILKSGQPDLFYNVPDGYQQRIQIKKGSQTVLLLTPEYNVIEREISFPLPSVLLDNGEPYSIKLVNLPNNSSEGGGLATNTTATAASSPIGGMYGSSSNSSSSNNNNNSTNTAPVASNSMATNFPNGGNAPVTNDNATGGNTPLPQNLYEWHFRTSIYNTLNEKLDDFMDNYSVSGAEDLVFKYINPSEGFDVFETGVSTDTESLISVEAINNHNVWFNSIQHRLYEYFPGTVSEAPALFFAAELTNRPLDLGMPFPLKTIELSNFKELELPAIQAQAGIVPPITGGRTSIIYSVPSYVEGDYQEFREQLLFHAGDFAFIDLDNEFGPYPFPGWVNVITSDLGKNAPPVVSGTYPIQIRYKLPGKTTYSTTRKLDFVK